MYRFVDTTEVSEDIILPSEALKINGEYIENLIPGYRTLRVSGREALSPELSHYETGIRDGAVRKSKRYPARVIKVEYLIKAKTNAAFRSAYNALAMVLDVEDAELIFNDEPDKFFTGTPSYIGEIEPGSNVVTGEFEITCEDPFKYSVEEYEIEPTFYTETNEDGTTVLGQKFLVDYNGTYKAYPTFKTQFYEESEINAEEDTVVSLTGNGDCGFVAFYNTKGKIIQIGDPDEAGDEELIPSQTLVNQSFKASQAWDAAGRSLWNYNCGVETIDSMIQSGSMRTQKGYEDENGNVYALVGDDFGDVGDGKWHGPTITRAIPADDEGEIGAKNFTLTYSQKMACKNDRTWQFASFHALLVSGSGDERKIVAGVNIRKGSTGKTADVHFIVNGKVVETMEIDLSWNNIYFGEDNETITTVKTSTIKKFDDTVTFNVGGIKKSFTDSEITDMVTEELTFAFGQYNYVELCFNGLYSVKFVKDKCTTWRDIPNKFSANDILNINCKTGEIFLNNTPTPEYGALGNDWEDFYLQPGTNEIGITFSDWVSAEYAPSFKLRYREVFI